MSQAKDVNQESESIVPVMDVFKHIWFTVVFNLGFPDEQEIDYCKRCGSNRKYLEREGVPCKIVEITLRTEHC